MRSQRRSRGLGRVLGLAVALVAGAARPVLGSGQGNTQSGSSNSSASNSDSSKGSNDSSNSSKSSSDNSHGSSKDSDNSTQNSPKNSTDYTSKNSSDWTTNSHGAHVFSIALVVVAVGATVVGTLAVNNRRRKNQARQTAALAEFMRKQHALLTHDVTTADGPMLDAWAHDLGLGEPERRRLRRALEGSAEQGVLLEALDGSIDESHARRFAGAFVQVTERALGSARSKTLVARAAHLTDGG